MSMTLPLDPLEFLAVAQEVAGGGTVAADYELLSAASGRRNWRRNWARAQRIINDILPLLRSI